MKGRASKAPTVSFSPLEPVKGCPRSQRHNLIIQRDSRKVRPTQRHKISGKSDDSFPRVKEYNPNTASPAEGKLSRMRGPLCLLSRGVRPPRPGRRDIRASLAEGSSRPDRGSSFYPPTEGTLIVYERVQTYPNPTHSPFTGDWVSTTQWSLWLGRNVQFQA